MIHRLGSLASSEALIKDLYLSLRKTVGAWSEITQQTPQARMGYVGQHLVSVVTGFPGGKSGARGYDLVMPNGGFGEIKTCYRVDQLGACQKCESGVSSLELKCSFCGSKEVTRKDDSKWLLSIKTDSDFAQILDPKFYFLVLFEFEDLYDATNQNIIASIWEIDPLNLGFALCMIDYKINIQSNSVSSAPFNLWPYSPKFYLMKPNLIYRSLIGVDSIQTEIFPKERGNTIKERVPDVRELLRKKTLTLDAMIGAIKELGGTINKNCDKRDAAELLQSLRVGVKDDYFADLLASFVYSPLLKGKTRNLPKTLIGKIPFLSNLH